MSVWRGKEEEKRYWVHVSASAVEGEGERRSSVGEGVKLKSPRRMGSMGKEAVRGERAEVMNAARAE